MHILQPKHTKLKAQEVKALLDKYNISLAQLPKIKKDDPALEGAEYITGEVVKIERKEEEKNYVFFRVVV